MNTEMAYLLGMICGNGEVRRENRYTTISIRIPHKKLKTEEFHDVKLYVKASITNIRDILEPLLSSDLRFSQGKHATELFFTKSNDDYLIREILRMIKSSTTRVTMRVPKEILNGSTDEKCYFLKGISDVTGYIRRSNQYYKKYEHRVYLEVPNNWLLVVDLANLLTQIDIPIQTIDWAHPNMRDGFLKKYNSGNVNFWKKEHQIKIWANEFLKIGFGIIHKQQALEKFAKELITGFEKDGKMPNEITHKFYWETANRKTKKPIHPMESDESIPDVLRGKHYESWKDIARELGYHE